ncbi:sulfatase-like hydrolase/transferase [Halomonas beimenensis]|uniref:sulfatase-like hydrolase/transferase n=1 Tax=Halomonas beimenensis TaxID=475662 RepID=UPI001D0E1A20|nr:sulfatase-like hydrolase/transferase [Halomonas beimenensis]
MLFITDQQRADHLGCYGDSTVRTPHLDRLAAEGVRFTRFHVATPICQPNRACLVTGQQPSVNGVRQNGIPRPGQRHLRRRTARCGLTRRPHRQGPLPERDRHPGARAAPGRPSGRGATGGPAS